MDTETCPPELDRFVRIVGRESWQRRIDQIVAEQRPAGRPTLCGRDVLRRHAVEVAIERQRRPGARAAGADRRIVQLAADACRLHRALPAEGRRRFEAALEAAMLDGQSLMPLFHLLRTAWLHRSRGFEVEFAGFRHGTTHDLELEREGSAAEVVCDSVSAEDGRGVHRGAWSRLVDLVSPELGPWLAANPGRYLLKMTLPAGLKSDLVGAEALGGLGQRIRVMLEGGGRADGDAVAVMRLDPLPVPLRRESGEDQVLARLRDQFGPDTHLAATVGSGGCVFAMAAHAGRENDVPAALRRRMAEFACGRLSGGRPGILAMFVDDVEPTEWRRLRAELRLEAEARRFLTTADAIHVVSVACTSRHEMFDRDCSDGEFRFRNPRHVAARFPGLAPSILSSN